jgi:flavin-binding protein dodecin
MPDQVYKSIELTGSSSTSIEDAINVAVARAGQTIRGIKWLQVIDTRAYLENNKVAYWQVTVKLGFTVL